MPEHAAIVGLPPVLPLEAPSSWVTRAALSQGASVEDFSSFLGFASGPDFDVSFLSGDLRERVKRCGLPNGTFVVAQNLVLAALRVDRYGRRLLLRSKSRRARFRYCPRCMSESPTAYHPIHCRFAPWRFCPEHDCLLEDACWSCLAPLDLPASLATRGPQHGIAAYLSQCIQCGKGLGKVQAVDVRYESQLLRPIEQAMLQNGRATLAALSRGSMALWTGRKVPLSHLSVWIRMGMLSTSGDALSAMHVRNIKGLPPTSPR
jgi:hypothetical protein